MAKWPPLSPPVGVEVERSRLGCICQSTTTITETTHTEVATGGTHREAGSDRR
jgi:hypothetical protein